jgi:hypothetical protein
MNRSTLLMLGAAILLAGLVLLFANPFGGRGGGRAEAPLFAAVQNAQPDHIEIHAPPPTPATVLERQGQDWVVASQANFPADTAAVHSILRAVAGARSSEIVSNNPANRGKFQVDSTGVDVRISEGTRELAHFVVGKGGQDFTTSYVRPVDSNQVRVVRGINRNMFQRARGFRDLALFRFDPATVAKVQLQVPGGGWTLTRGDTAWTVSSPGAPGGPGKKEVVDQLLNSLSRLSADDINDEPDSAMVGVAHPDTVLTVTFQDGLSQTLSVGRRTPGTGQRYARTSKAPTVYLLAEWRIRSFAKTADDLRGVKKPEPAGANAAGAKGKKPPAVVGGKPAGAKKP